MKQYQKETIMETACEICKWPSWCRRVYDSPEEAQEALETGYCSICAMEQTLKFLGEGERSQIDYSSLIDSMEICRDPARSCHNCLFKGEDECEREMYQTVIQALRELVSEREQAS